MTDHKRYMKPRMLCPYCQRPMTINGMTTHVNMKHPDKRDEFKANREQLIQEFRIDEEGALIDDRTTNNTTTQVDPEVISETPPAPPEPIIEDIPIPPTPPTPTPPPTPPPEPKVPPTDKFQGKEDDTKPTTGRFKFDLFIK